MSTIVEKTMIFMDTGALKFEDDYFNNKCPDMAYDKSESLLI